MYKESRELFKNPDVITDKAELEKIIKFGKPEEDELKAFLSSKSFTEQKVEAGLKKLQNS